MNLATKKYSSAQESMIANTLNWKVVAGSGAVACLPGDVISDNWLGECKTHTSPRQKIQFMRNHWEKIKEEAMMKRRMPILFTDDGSQKAARTWCLFALNCIKPVDCVACNFPSSIRTNVIASHEFLQSLVTAATATHPGANIIFISKWKDEDICICNLKTFAYLIGVR